MRKLIRSVRKHALAGAALVASGASALAADGDMPAAISTATTSVTTLQTTIIGVAVAGALAFIGISWLRKLKPKA